MDYLHFKDVDEKVVKHCWENGVRFAKATKMGLWAEVGKGIIDWKAYGELLKELLYYGVSSISLSTTGSEQQGVRACTSRMRNELYEVLQERMKAFNEDHPLNK